MKSAVLERKPDVLQSSLHICWLLTVFSSFWGAGILRVSVPGVGALFPFRILLPITAMLYLVQAVRTRENIWKGASLVEKLCYILVVIMLVHGALSLLWAIEPLRTFQKLFNLILDLCFFFLMLRICRDENLLQKTLLVCGIAVALLMFMGIYEVFFGGIFHDKLDDFLRFWVFDQAYQSPLVSYQNQNDYASALVMCSGAFLLWLGKAQKLKENNWAILTICFMGLLYFLLKAAMAGLCLVAYYVLFAGLVIYLAIWDRRRLWIAVGIAVLIFAVQIININQPEGKSLEEHFLVENPETGELELREDGTAGVRSALLLHALDCFLESNGLGVGLGNTEILARDYHITHNGVYNIHCFIARIIADFGVFVLLPLCAIGVLLIRRVWLMLRSGLRSCDMHLTGFAVLYLFVLLLYPFASTAPSDAQDLIGMWIYLGAIVLLGRDISNVRRT